MASKRKAEPGGCGGALQQGTLHPLSLDSKRGRTEGNASGRWLCIVWKEGNREGKVSWVLDRSPTETSPTAEGGDGGGAEQPGLGAEVLLGGRPVAQDAVDFRHHVRRHLGENLGQKAQLQTRKQDAEAARGCGLTWMAPRFSLSCSALEVPRRTELTPSFLRHQAGGRHGLKFTRRPQGGDGGLIGVLPTASWGSVQPSFSVTWLSSCSWACCLLPSSLAIFSFNH